MGDITLVPLTINISYPQYQSGKNGGFIAFW